jgi:hypothetical protein
MLAFFEHGVDFSLVELVIGLLLFCNTLLWLWPLVDCLWNEPSQGSKKLVWVLVIVMLQSLGGMLYLSVRRPKRIQELGR